MKFRHLMALLVGATTMAMAVPAWSIPLENPIPGNYWTLPHAPAINFTGVNINYLAWPTGSGLFNGTKYNTGTMLATSTSASTYKLVSAPGYASSVSFKGNFALLAQITPTGTLQSGKFAFTSSDAMFGFGTTKVCDSKGRNCVQQPNTGVVFAADLNKFGWSSAKKMLEFQTTNLTGWVKTKGWASVTERINFIVPAGLKLCESVAAVKCWSATNVSGTAVVPEPSTVLLLGSGLAGLLGFARRRKN